MGAAVPLLLFRVEGQRYGLPLRVVARVIPVVELAVLPGAPEVIRGVFSWHGEIVPTGDLRRRYRMAPRDLSLGDHIVITQRASSLFGLLTEGATDVTSCKAEDIAGADIVTYASETVEGIAHLADGLIVIQNLEKFLSSREETSLAKALNERH